MPRMIAMITIMASAGRDSGRMIVASVRHFGTIR